MFGNTRFRSRFLTFRIRRRIRLRSGSCSPFDRCQCTMKRFLVSDCYSCCRCCNPDVFGLGVPPSRFHSSVVVRIHLIVLLFFAICALCFSFSAPAMVTSGFPNSHGNRPVDDAFFLLFYFCSLCFLCFSVRFTIGFHASLIFRPSSLLKLFEKFSVFL